MIDLSQHRKDFPMMHQKMHGKSLIYFDSAATAQKPQVVIDAMTDFYQNHYGTVHRTVYDLASNATDMCNQVRIKVQKFINAKSADEIVFTRGTTDSINLVASSFGRHFIKSGDTILLSQLEHHSNIVPWQMLCEEVGAKIKVIPVDDNGEVILEEYESLLSEGAKFVSLTHVANSIGTIMPVREMIAMAHVYGAKILIDGAQSIPHLEIDIQDLQPDFFVFSGHKLYGPTGVGILYGKKELLEVMPPYQGGGDMIEKVTFEKTTYNVPPIKFEAGTPMIAEIIGLGAAIDYVSAVGLKNIFLYERSLLHEAAKLLKRVDGVKIFGPKEVKGPIISFAIDGVHPLDIGTLMDLKGVAMRTGHLCAEPTLQRFNVPSLARISFGLYNTKEEIHAFHEHLSDVLTKLRGQS